MNRLSTEKRVQVVSALVEGSSINAIARMTGIAKRTILKLLEDMGCACAARPLSRFETPANLA
jgi:transposase-like protein